MSRRARAPIFRLAGLGLLASAAIALGVSRAPLEPVPVTPAVPGLAAEATVAREGLRLFTIPLLAPDDASRLIGLGFDVLEHVEDGALQVLGDDSTGKELLAAGFRFSVDEGFASDRLRSASYYAGYHTVAEHEAHLRDVVARYPKLAQAVDYGNSWKREQDPNAGYTLKALCITRRQRGDCALDPRAPKPRFLIIAAVHARELSTSEIAWRWIDALLEGDGVDPEITRLLDTTEMWVIPVANPDGRAIVEQGGDRPLLQRKNANSSAGACAATPTAGNQFGVDLNRNANFLWAAPGASGRPCSQFYFGVAAASEPEEQGLEKLMTALYPDRKGPALTDPALITTTGAMLTLHAYGNSIMIPWGFTECRMRACPEALRAPNDIALRAFAFRMASFNAYLVGQSAEILYVSSGTTDDWLYGQLGVPAFTVELGPMRGACGGFSPAYACVDTVLWPQNRDALIYAAKLATQPYSLTLGPRVTISSALTLTVTAGASFTVTAIADDDAFGPAKGSFGRPAVQNIAEVEATIDAPPGPGARLVALLPADGAYNAPREIAWAVINTKGWARGRHTVYVRARDASGVWGPLSVMWVTIR
ncbi:MAG: M14 family zinc carboxypeptidase [Thermoflexales bacterium]